MWNSFGLGRFRQRLFAPRPRYPEVMADYRRTWFEMDHLEHGRECYGRRAWGDAYDALLCADQATPLDVDDLDRLATAAYLTGRDLEFRANPGTPHRVHVESGDRARAARCAFWLAITILLRGETGQANAWTARGQRLVEDHDCVERGYLAVAVAEQQLREGQADAAHATAGQAVAIGESFGDADLTAAARHAQGRALIQQGDVVAGLKRLDETMLAVVAGELSPIMTASMYCSVIDTCRQVYALGRAREWTVRVFERVRATAGDGRVHRHLPGASCRDHATAGGVAGRVDRSLPRV